MNTLRFPGTSLEELRNGLLAHAPSEGGSILLAERVQLGDRIDFLVRETFHAAGESVQATPYNIEISPTFIAHVMKRARNNGLCLFFAHSHPTARRAQFSLIDDAGERRLLPTVFQRIASGPHGAVVVTPSDCAARTYTSADSEPTSARVAEVGDVLRTWYSEREVPELDHSTDRTVRALGEEAQRTLGELRVGIVGLGGMGSLVTQQLAHLGVKFFVLIDHDAVHVSNLNRLVGATPSLVGARKVDVAARLVQMVQPAAILDARAGDVRFEPDTRRLLGLDVVFCCTDSHGSRAIVNQIAQQYFVPVIDTGVRIDATDGNITSVVGRVQLLSPGRPCLVCEGLLDPEEVRRDLLSEDERERDPYIVGAREVQPAVISINGAVASLAVTMLLAFACGFPLASRHQIYLADKGVVRNVTADKDAACFVCGARGAFGRGDRWNVPWRRQ